MDKVRPMTLTRQSAKQVFSASSNKEMCYGLLRDECAMFYFSISKSHKKKIKVKCFVNGSLNRNTCFFSVTAG